MYNSKILRHSVSSCGVRVPVLYHGKNHRSSGSCGESETEMGRTDEIQVDAQEHGVL